MFTLSLMAMTAAAGTRSRAITVANGRFEVDGKPILLLGAAVPWHHWNEFGHDFDVSWWSDQFAKLAATGANCTHVWLSCDGANDSPGITADGLVRPPTAKFWQDVDELFRLAQEHRLYLLVSLISFNHSKPDGPASGPWRLMYASVAGRRSFVDNYVRPLVRRYRENPYFFGLEAGSELDWVWEGHGVRQDDVLDLVARSANAVHGMSDVLVFQGTGAGPKYNSIRFSGNIFSGASLGSLQQGTFVDFYSVHYYDWQKKWFGSPFQQGPYQWHMAEKPCLIGEYPAKGTSDCKPLQCLQQAYALGWQGMLAWTANGVDANGNLEDFKDAFVRFGAAHRVLIAPEAKGESRILKAISGK